LSIIVPQRDRRNKLEELISPKELSKLLKVSKPWPYIMVERGLLPYYKMGEKGKRGIIRFRMSDIETYLNRCRVERKN
jgi:excisionase family DNA binding protein